jgi:hypothetical protein
MTQGKPHDREPAALKVSHGIKDWILDCIGTGFVEGIAALHVTGDLVIRVVAHPDSALAQFVDHATAVSVPHAGTAVHFVAPPSELPEHVAGLSGTVRFSQDLSVQHDNGVRSNDDLVGPDIVNGRGLGPAHTYHELRWRFTIQGTLVDTGGLDQKGQA